MRYLSAAEIVAIHDRILEETQKGLVGVRDERLLRSITARPAAAFGGVEQFKTVFEKAAAIFEAIATYHVFLDANKRTAIAAASVFLRANGYQTDLSNEEVDELILSGAQKQRSIGELAAWLEAHSRKIDT